MGWPELFAWLKGDFDSVRMEPLDGGLTSVRSIGAPEEEHKFLKESAAVLPIPKWFLMKVHGPDALDYLHRRLSRSIKTLPENSGAHALQLGGDGRLQCDLLAYRSGGAAWILAYRRNLQEAYNLTEKYILMDKVEIDRQWEMEGTISLAGPKADEIVSRLVGVNSPPAPWAMIPQATIAGAPCRLFRDDRFKIPFYHVVAPLDQLEGVARSLAEASRAEGGGLAGKEAWDFVRIEQGIAMFGIDIDATTIPLEADLWDAIDFDKGCFPGQEVMARIRNLGHPARQLVRLEIEAEIKLGAKAAIYVGDQEVGAVTSARAMAGRTLALGFVEWAAREADAGEVIAAEGRAPARIKRLDGNMMASLAADSAGKGAKP